MSLEAALDEERLDVIALLEGRALPSHTKQTLAAARGSSPANATRSPVRSMLDVGDGYTPTAARHASIAGQGVGVTKPSTVPYPTQTIRSMLDTTSPPPTPGDPVLNPSRATLDSPPLRSGGARQGVEKGYNFEMLPTNEHGTLPKRVTQGGKKDKKSKGSFFGSMDSGRSDTARALLGHTTKSRSPVPGRSKSPGLNRNNMNLMTSPNTYISDSGKVIDMTSAYRRLSDGAMLQSRGALSGLPSRKGSDPARGEELAPDGGIRLTKDYDPEGAVESSDNSSDSSDEGWNSSSRRGRVRTRSNDDETEEETRAPKSLLAAAEDEREYWASLSTSH
jgi:hypothetical protein